MPADERNPEECLMPECTRDAETRGLCRPCYSAAYAKVSVGEISWSQLEAKGWARPAFPARGAASRAIETLTAEQQPQ